MCSAMASRADDSILRVEKSDGQNFHLWKFKMQMVLEDKDLWDIVSGEEVEPSGQGSTDDAARGKCHQRSRTAMATICLLLSDSQLLLVRSAKTAKDAWLKLESHYEKKSLANKLFLRRKYLTTMLLDGDRMIDHVNNVRSLAEHLDYNVCRGSSGNSIV